MCVEAEHEEVGHSDTQHHSTSLGRPSQGCDKASGYWPLSDGPSVLCRGLDAAGGLWARTAVELAEPSATSRQSTRPGRVTPSQDEFDGLCLLLDCQELLGKVLNSVAKEAILRDGGAKKANLEGVHHLIKVEPEMAFQHSWTLHGRHCLAVSPRRDLQRSKLIA